MSGSRVPCEPCRTINLAKTILQEKGKGCTPLRKPDCSGIPELRLNPACIRVCNQDKKNKPKVALPKTPIPYYAHGKFLWVVKTGILVGSVYFTYTQGVWGDQQTSMECLNRWAEYIHSINTRRPPKFDECGNVVRTGGSIGNLTKPLYRAYKECITTCFAGVVKVPVLMKCAYINYLESLEKKIQQEKLEAAYKKK